MSYGSAFDASDEFACKEERDAESLVYNLSNVHGTAGKLRTKNALKLLELAYKTIENIKTTLMNFQPPQIKRAGQWADMSEKLKTAMASEYPAVELAALVPFKLRG